jgi:MFS family permease
MSDGFDDDVSKGRFGALRERQFRLLFVGRTVSMLGTAMAPVALAFAILNTLHGSASDIGIVLACRQVPVVVLLLVGGVWGDRLPRNLVMVASNVISGASQGIAAALLLSGHATLSELAALAALNGASTAFFFPASAGVLPLLVTKPLLQRANAALRLGLNITTIAGAALGGLLVAATNPGVAIAIDAASYLLAAVALARMIRLPSSTRVAAESVLHGLRAGWRDFTSRGWLWAIVVQFGIVNAVESGAVNVLGPGVAKAHFGGPAAWGLILTMQTLGLVASGLVLLRWRPRRILLAATFGAFGLALLPLVLARPLPLGGVMAGAFCAGVGMEVFGVLWQTAMQQEIPIEKLSRLSSYDALGSWALIPIGSALTAPIASALGTTRTFVGVVAVVVIVTSLVLFSSDVRTLQRH